MNHALPIVAEGIVSSAMSFVFIRDSSEPSIMLASWRVLLASIALSPLYFMARRRHGDVSVMCKLQRSWQPGLILAIHFMTWVVGARLTTEANATLIVNLMPLVIVSLLLVVWNQRVPDQTPRKTR